MIENHFKTLNTYENIFNVHSIDIGEDGPALVEVSRKDGLPMDTSVQEARIEVAPEVGIPELVGIIRPAKFQPEKN